MPMRAWKTIPLREDTLFLIMKDLGDGAQTVVQAVMESATEKMWILFDYDEINDVPITIAWVTETEMQKNYLLGQIVRDIYVAVPRRAIL